LSNFNQDFVLFTQNQKPILRMIHTASSSLWVRTLINLQKFSVI